jgi:carbamate kinase
MKKIAVIALGGNALLRGNQLGTIDEQEQNTTDTLENLVYLIKKGYRIVITHGNGPQVGNILMQNDAGESIYGIPQMPVDICVASSQGEIGYMIERMMRNVLQKYNIKKELVTLVTMSVVDKNDSAFHDPTKRIGKTYTQEEAEKLEKAKGWLFKEDAKLENGWRRVVPSPYPIKIINEDVIENLIHQDILVIANGGGGIPVYYDENNNVRPSEVVIDKDLSSALLAARIKADELYMLTDVPYVYLNYKKNNQQAIEKLDSKDAQEYLRQGMFGEGSMAPKIKAALSFLKNGGKTSIITEATKLEDMSYGTKITMRYE